jgi:predicted transcriptional regulator
MAQNEYDESRTIVRNITFGFTRQAKRMENNIQSIGVEVSEAKILASQALSNIKNRDESMLQSLEAVKIVNDRVEKIEQSLDKMKTEVNKLVSQPRTVIRSHEVDAPIPVQGESILQKLTDTELGVLTMIENMGEGTVPQIRTKIGKTREHTARLLKKLYDSGYIDRNTSSMPYKYSIRKEIKDLIQESKENAPLRL